MHCGECCRVCCSGVLLQWCAVACAVTHESTMYTHIHPVSPGFFFLFSSSPLLPRLPVPPLLPLLPLLPLPQANVALGLDPNLRVEQLNELSNLGYDVQAHTGNTGHTGHGGNGGNPEFNGLNVNGLISPDQASSAMVAMDWQEREAMNQRIQNQQGALLGVK